MAVIRCSRRLVLFGLAGFVATPAISGNRPTQSHGLSSFNDLRYPRDFKHLAYVNPVAPKGGLFSSCAFPGSGGGTFDSLNTYILEGTPAIGMEWTFASLMARAFDEPDSVYGLAAEYVEISSNELEYRFLLRKGLKYHDGTIISADDVAFSLLTLKKFGHPYIQSRLEEIQTVEPTDDRTLLIRFEDGRSRDAPLYAAAMPIFSKKYYSDRKFGKSTLDIPLGSGPYKVSEFEAGRFIEYARVQNWWGEALPICRGLYNFDRIRYEYFRDRMISFEGLIAKNYLFREELSSRIWATGYNVPAVRSGAITRVSIPDGRPCGGPGWAFNLRRQKFQQKKVREALILAFDFEWVNKYIMFESYRRIHSYFQNTEMMARGFPSRQEQALLETFKGQVDEEVFGMPWSPPVSDGSGHDHSLLMRAATLLTEAGWIISGGKRISSNGSHLSIELLYVDRAFEPHQAAYAQNLSALGVELTQRLVDPAQFVGRMNDFDFDMAIYHTSADPTPGEGLRSYFTSAAATARGQFNYGGIADPVIDALVGRIVGAVDRDELTYACRALDRVLRAGRYWVPLWYKPDYWLAYWNQFSRPAVTPKFWRGAPETWWYDGVKGKSP